MQKQKNVQIPLDVFNDIVELLYSLEDCAELCNAKLAALYKKVDAAIRQKRIAMLHRETYAEIIRASDGFSKDAARENYLATKQIYLRSN